MVTRLLGNIKVSTVLRGSLRLFVGVALVLCLFYYVGFRGIMEVFCNLRWPYIVVLLLLSVLLIWVSCLKWQLFIRSAGHEVRVIVLMRYYTQSYFFSMFMPSIIGGDVARSYQLGKVLGSYRSVFAATFIERFTGFLAMTIVGLTFVLLGAKATAGTELALVLVCVVTFVISAILFSRKLSVQAGEVLLSCVKSFKLRGVHSKLEDLLPKIHNAVEFARTDRTLLVKAMGLAFSFHFLAAVNTYVAALAVGWEEVSLGSMCIVVPLVLLVSVIPITPSSVGVQEGAFLYFLTQVGATHSQALGVGLILRAKSLLTAIVGGLLFALRRR